MSRDKMQVLSNMLSHETAHFWFGGLVQSNLNEQWLSEGFAQFFCLYLNGIYFGSESKKAILSNYLDKLNEIPLTEQAPLANISLDSPNQVFLVRCKTAIVLNILLESINEKDFILIIRQTVKKYKNKFITTALIKELWTSMLPDFDFESFFRIHFYEVNRYVALENGQISTMPNIHM